MGYFKLLPNNAVSASTQGTDNNVVIASSRFCCRDRLSALFDVFKESLDQSDFTKLTTIRVPSLLAATRSERFTNKSIWESPVGGGLAISGGKIILIELSTNEKKKKSAV